MTTLSTDPSFHQKLADYRRKAADNTITLEEMREAVKLMRQGRVAAAAASTTAARKKAAAPVVDSNSLLDELSSL